MNAEIITVGTELLLGEIVNTNAKFLAEGLASCGISTYHQSTVGDNEQRLKKSLMLAGSRSDVIIISGGLGPTDDDITKQTVADAIGVPLVEDAKSLERIKDYFKRTGRPMTQNNVRQALIPEDAIVFDNDYGTAPGCALISANQCIIMLPGPPRELEPMFENYVKPFLARFSDGVIISHTIHVFGIGEAQTADMLGDVFDGENPTVAIYAGAGEVRLRVTASAENSLKAEQLCVPVMDRVLSTLGRFVYGIDRKSLEQVVVKGLKKNALVLATAESCTAGLLSKRITDVPGSSEIFHMGIAAYSNDVKSKVLGVSPELIRMHGAVSEAVARSMAIGVREVSGANIGISITGVAGESVESKPSGLIYLAMTDGANIWSVKLTVGRMENERDYVKHIATSNALDMLRRYLDALPGILEGGEPLLNPEENAVSAAVGTVFAITPADKPLKTSSDIEFDPSNLSFDDGQSGEVEASEDFEVNIPQEDYQSMDEPATDIGALFNEGTEAAFENPDVNPQNDLFDADFILSKGAEEGTELYPDAQEKVPEAKSVQKKKWYTRLLHYLIPWKGDPATEIARKIVFLAAVVALIVCGIYIGDRITQRFKYESAIGTARDQYNSGDNTLQANGMQAKFKALYEKNSDIRGWITIPNTKVDNPVYQATNDKYYLTHDMNKQKSIYGALFLDHRDKVEPNYNTQNQTIYGHHMKDSTMFANIKKYNDVNFYKKNPTLTYDTIYRDGTYKVFAAFITNAEAKDDNGYYFDYCVPEFASQTDFLAWIEQVRRRSLINTPVDVVENDQILTLSTCTYEISGTELRFVVMARRVRDGESELVNVSEAKQNAKPLYPAIWYEKKGSTKPIFKDGSYQWIPGSTEQIVTPVNPGATSSNTSTQVTSSGVTSSGVTSSGATSSGTVSSKTSSPKPITPKPITPKPITPKPSSPGPSSPGPSSPNTSSSKPESSEPDTSPNP